MATNDSDVLYEIAPELQERLVKLPGTWVAITTSRLLGVGDTAAEALEEARRKEPDTEAILRRNPAGRSVSYIF